MKRQALTPNHFAAVAVSLAILASSLLASTVPAAAAPAQPSYRYTAPTATPCLTICAGQINHR
jgi:hypothetical protein